MQKEKTDEEEVFSDEEHYRLAEVANPYEKDNEFMQNNDIPLKNEHIVVIFDCIDWNDIKWGETSIKFKDLLIESTVFFLKKCVFKLISDILNFKYYPNKLKEEI